MNVFIKLVIVLIFVLSGCSKVETNPAESVETEVEKPKKYVIDSAVLASVNRYISKDPKFQYYEIYKNDYTRAEYFDGYLTVNANNRDRPTLSIWQDENGRFLYQYLMYYEYNFKYEKNNVIKNAELLISYAFGTGEYFTQNFDEIIDLETNDAYFGMKYVDGKFVDNMEGSTKGNEIKFTEDLLKKLNQIYEEYSLNKISKKDEYIVNDLVAIISNNEVLTVRHDSEKNYQKNTGNNLDDFFDIEPIIIRITNPITHYKLDTGIYAIKNDKEHYGIIDNHGNIILDPKGNIIPEVYDEKEIYLDYSAYDNLENVNNYYIGGEHGLSTIIPYYDGNEVGIICFADDGLGNKCDSGLNDLASYNLSSYIKLETINGKNEYGQNYNVIFKFGIINGKKEILTKAIYDEVVQIGEKLILAKRNGTWFYVNEYGKEIFEGEPVFSYKYIDDGHEVWLPYPDVNGKVILKDKNGKYGVKDICGNIIIPFEYDDGTPFNGKILLKKDVKWKEFE